LFKVAKTAHEAVAEGALLAASGKDPQTPSSLDAWVLATAADAVAYAVSLLRDRAAAEDVVQDCYCRLLLKASEYDLLCDGRKLLFAAITNACLNHKARSRPVVSLDAPRADGLNLHEAIVDHAAAAPDSAILDRELEKAVAEALQRLPRVQRAALELKSLGHSLQDIGAALQVSPGNAAVLIHRARQAMAKHLAPYLEEQPR
jgi:RNA polymerase sigma-70 factor (ECF subfamily)